MDRSTVTLRCPGTNENGVVLAAIPDLAKFGIGHPKNVGDCKLLIVALDENNKPIEDLPLRPDESVHWYWPSSGTARIVAVCSKICHGTAALEFDTPIG